MTLTEYYRRFIETNGYASDDAQLACIARLERLSDELEARARRHWFVRRRHTVPKGLYVWGGVGRGKTFMMDLFFDHVELERKFRTHFHRFMRLVHDELRAAGRRRDPLQLVARRLARRYDLICFDEFFVSDIADAMLLGRLLGALFERGVTLVTTSNAPPGELYRDGLQRQQFLPAIALLERHCEIVNIDGGVDYRLRLLESSSIYLTPSDERAHARLAGYFRRIVPGHVEDGRLLEIEGRGIRTVRCGAGAAWFEFDELCDGPRSQNDYIELARLFQTVIVENVPVLDRDTENQARRFIALVDEFYDRRVKLIVSAAAELDALYQGSRLHFEFERTRSRLTEMRSHDYLAAGHRP